MYKSIHEEHGIDGNDLPFIFHTDSLGSVNYCALNWHTNIEILCCIKGKGCVKCEAQKYDFSVGDIFIVNSDNLHEVVTEECIEYHCLIVDRTFFISNSLGFDRLYFKELIKDEELFSEFIKIPELFKCEGEYRNAVIKHSILGFLILLCSKYAEERDGTEYHPPDSKRIKSVIRYIKKHISSPLTLDDIAAVVGVSKFHLSREFKKYTGYTIFEHINMMRCKESKRLIKEGMSVSAAALSCGFENMSYFTKTYKKYMGALPSDGKKKVMQKTTPTV